MVQKYSQMDFFSIHDNTDINRIFFVIDGNAYVYRSYYALKNLKNSKGMSINAVYIFFRTMIKLFNFIIDKKYSSPYICYAFDFGKEIFRSKIYKDYKSNRAKMPADLFEQFKIVKNILKSFGFSCFEMLGYEGDDVIASLCSEILKKDTKSEIYILTYDKDLFQLIKSNIKIFHFPNEIIDKISFKQQYGFSSEKIVDFLALCGDDIDNIKGIDKIGKKTAKAILDEYDSLEYILENINSINTKYRYKILENIDNLKLNLKLLTLKNDLDIDIDFKKIEFFDIFEEKKFCDSFKIFQDLEMFSIIKSLRDLWLKVKKNIPKSFDDFGIFHNVPKNKVLTNKKSNIGIEKINLFDCFISFYKNSIIIYDYVLLKDFNININFSLLEPYQVQSLDKFQFVLGKKNTLDKILLTNNAKNLLNFLYYNNIEFDFKNYFIFDVVLFRYLLEIIEIFDLEQIKKLLLSSDKKKIYLNSIEKLKGKKLLSFYNFHINFSKIISDIEKNYINIDIDYLILLKENLIRNMTNVVYKIFDIVGFTFDINSKKQVNSIFKDIFNIDVNTERTFFSKYELIDIYLKMNNEFSLYFLEYINILDLVVKIINPIFAEKKNFIKIAFKNETNVLEYKPEFDIDFFDFYLQDKNLIKKIFVSDKNSSFLVIKIRFIVPYIVNFFTQDDKLNDFLDDTNSFLESNLFKGILLDNENFINEIFYNTDIEDLVYNFRIEKNFLSELKSNIFKHFQKTSLFYKNFNLKNCENTIFGNKIILSDVKNPIKEFIKFNISDIFKKILTVLQREFFINDSKLKFKILYFSEDKILLSCLDKDLEFFVKKITCILDEIFKFYIPIIFDIEIGKNYGEMEKINLKEMDFTENLFGG